MLLACALVAGCSSDEPSPLEEAQATPTVTAPAEDPEAEVLATWEAYWDAIVASEGSADPEDPALDRLRSVAAPALAERQVGIVRRYAGYGLVRTGEPAVRDEEVTVDGDTATVTACFSEDDWEAERNGETVPSEDRGFVPVGAQLERRDDGWIVVSDDAPEDVTC